MYEPYGPTGLALAPAPGPEPTRIGRYLVTGELGRTPFMTVFRAVHEQNGTPVAIRLLSPEATADAALWGRFVAEGQQLRTVASPGVVTLHESDELDTGQPYLVVDLADRGDLRTRVEQHKLLRRPVTADDALLVAEALTEALAPLHAAHIVHRDLTPTSLLICSGAPPRADDGLLFADEELKLADLGLGRALAELAGPGPGGAAGGGNPAQQRDPFGIVDPRVDIYAASALLYWLVTGTHPGPAPERNRAELARSPFPSVFQAALMAGLSDDPAQRQGSIDAWYDELAGLSWPARPTPPPPAVAPIDLTDDPLPGRAGRHLAPPVAPRRRTALAVVTAGLIVGSTALALGVPMLLRHRGGALGTGAAPVVPVTVQAGAGGPGTTVPPSSGGAPSSAPPFGLPMTLPGAVVAPTATGSTLPLAQPAPTVIPGPATAPHSGTATTRRTTAPSTAARTPAAAARTSTTATATTGAAGSDPISPTSNPPTSQPVATLTAGTNLVGTACGTLAVAPSATAGWRDLQWVPSSTYTSRAIAYLSEPWWSESDGAVSLHAPDGSFTVTVRCHDGTGAAVSAPVKVA